MSVVLFLLILALSPNSPLFLSMEILSLDHLPHLPTSLLSKNSTLTSTISPPFL